MTAPAHTADHTRRAAGPSAKRLALIAVAAVAGNLVLALLLRAVTDTSGDFLPMQPGPVAVATLIGVIAGAVLWLVLRRFLRRPEPVFLGLVVLGALLSLGGPLSLLGASPADQPGVTDTAALALIPLHLVPAVALLVGVLGGRRGGDRAT